MYQHGADTGHKVTVGGEFGHETVSRVVKVGANVTGFTPGQRVYPYPLYARGDTRRAGTLGGFSEYISVPNARLNHSLYDVPQCISDKTACLIEPFTVGCRAARRSRAKCGEKAVVFGSGTIGIAAAISLKWFGVSQVMICDISDYRLNIAKRLGFSVCNTHNEDFSAKAKEYFGTGHSLNGEVPDADIFIDAAGAPEILDLYMKLGKIESRYVSVAVNKALVDLDLLHLTFSQKEIIGSGGYMPEDVKDVLAIMSSGKWDIESVITHEFTLDELDKALETAVLTDKALNVVIKFDDED